jgi:hypothetical protein
MLRSDVQSWLEIVRSTSQECGWDQSLLITMETDDRTFFIQVRKSPLVFTVKQETRDPGRYTATYTVFPYNSTPDATARRFTAGQSRSAAFVGEELDRWLRQLVAKYVAETGLPD